MTAPVRLQLSRRRGFQLQDHSLAVNGLHAINVARPGRWGNPYAGDGTGLDHAYVVDLFARHMFSPGKAEYRAQARAVLAGHNLACWCPPGEPCHAEVLLALANEPEPVDLSRFLIGTGTK